MKTVLLISDSEVCTTILDLYENNSMIVEPAGALSVAALEKMKDEIKGKNVVCIVSGGNNDISRMADIKVMSQSQQNKLFFFIADFYL